MPLTEFPPGSAGSADGSGGEVGAGIGGVDSALLTSTAKVFRLARIKDGFGTASSVPDLLAVYPCKREKTFSPREVLEGGRVRAVSTCLCRFPLNADVQPPYRVVIEEQEYEVIDNDRGLTDATLLTVTLARTKRKTTLT